MLILLITLSLCGCFDKERVRVEIQYVEVPVPIKAEQPPVFEKSQYAVDLITPLTPDKEVASAYFDSLVMCRGDLLQRDNVLNAYREKIPEQKEEK